MLRREVASPIEIIRSATIIGAEIVRMQGKLGVIEPGALADLIVVDGDPLKDLSLFQNQGQHLSVIMKQGRLHKNRLSPAS
jgi:imidazolonepropionase-like amidohydrolase